MKKLKFPQKSSAIYHEEFKSILKSFGFWKTIPTLLYLKIELLKCGSLEALMAISFLIYTFIGLTKIDLIEILNSGIIAAMKKELFKDPKYQSYIKQKLPSYLKNVSM